MPRACRKILAAAFLFWAALPTSNAAIAGSRVPAWLSEGASKAVPQFDPRVPAVVLLNEEILTLQPDGNVKGVARYAVRILRYEGRQSARGVRLYRTDGGSIRAMDAWLMKPTGAVTTYGKGKTLDAAAALNDVYNEARLRVIDASADADVGDVFGCEIVFEERTFSGQFVWDFQDDLPVARSRFSLELPPGWSANALTFNHDPVPSEVVGIRRTWELTSLPWIKDEPARPPVTALTPRLVVDAVPPLESSQRSGLVSFGSWERTAAWLDDLSAPSASDASLASKAQLLISGAATKSDQVRAIGRYVQGLAYIAIQLGVSRGGGYRPHPAAEVLAKSYGDCKDKANLMKALLGCVGIESYLALVRASDPGFVRAEWPSPLQFDHCIIAVRADAESCSALVRHPTRGPLIFFDPTDPNTPFGDLPEAEQGGLALLVMKDGGDVIRVPVVPAERNHLERRIEAELDATGAIRGFIHESSRGREATSERRLYRGASQAEYQRAIESWITEGAPAATVSAINPRDDQGGSQFELQLTFSAPAYAQVTGPRMMLFRPAIVSRRERLSLTEHERTYPVVLRGLAYGESAGFKLPAGFAVEEIPPPVSLTSSFGSYSATIEMKDGSLRYNRWLKLSGTQVPVNEYESLRVFFERIRSSELTPVVLSRH